MWKIMPLISIIVPVYQVKEYLTQCIESILNQTYSTLEIILVDDGSSDGSVEICDQYARRDQRIQVIHKENGGLSSARNAGLKQARGDFIGFIDSDDWIEPQMYEMLYNAISDKGDIAVCNYFYDDIGREYEACNRNSFMVDSYQALELLIADEIPNYAWNKLYRRNLFQGLNFPEGRYYEDVAIMYLLFERANYVSFLGKALYHYRYRKSGIIGNRNLSGKLDYCEFRLERWSYCETKYPELKYKHIHGIADATVRMVASYIMSNRIEKRLNMLRRHKIKEFYEANIESYGYTLSAMEKIIFYLDTREIYLLDLIAIGLEMIRRQVNKCRRKMSIH